MTDITQTLETTDFPVVDFHVHLPVANDDWLAPWRRRYIAENGVERWQQLENSGEQMEPWLSEFCFPEPEPPIISCLEAADRWAEECRRAGLGRVVFLTGGGNESLGNAVATHKDLFSGFAHHPIDDPDAAGQLSYAIDKLGLSGYKILAPLVEKPLSDRAYDDVFSICHERYLPVVIHFGILGGGGGHALVNGPNLSPLALAETAKRFPHARFIVPHFGCGFTNDLLQLCWASPNVRVDTSGNNLWTKWTMENYTLEQLFHRFYSTVGPGRIVFGSDSAWFPRGFAIRYLLDQLRAVRALNMPSGDIRRIFRENALELLDI